MPSIHLGVLGVSICAGLLLDHYTGLHMSSYALTSVLAIVLTKKTT